MAREFDECIYPLNSGGGWTERCNHHFVFYEHCLCLSFSSHSSIPSLPQTVLLRTLRVPWTCSCSFHPRIISAFLPCRMSLKCNFHCFGSVCTEHLLCVSTVVGAGNSMESKLQSLCWSRRRWEAVWNGYLKAELELAK